MTAPALPDGMTFTVLLEEQPFMPPGGCRGLVEYIADHYAPDGACQESPAYVAELRWDDGLGVDAPLCERHCAIARALVAEGGTALTSVRSLP